MTVLFTPLARFRIVQTLGLTSWNVSDRGFLDNEGIDVSDEAMLELNLCAFGPHDIMRALRTPHPNEHDLVNMRVAAMETPSA